MSGFVYLIAPEAVYARDEEALKVVKIGFTKSHPKVRLSTLQTGSPVTLELLAYFDGDLELERALHCAFDELRWQGEWFRLDRKLGDFVGYLVDQPDQSRYVEWWRVIEAAHDNIFARRSSHPRWSDKEYCASCDEYGLTPYFPEVFA